jgi:uncharacterized RDD family membrane protein YckC
MAANAPAAPATDARPRALVGWRLLALVYDVFPVLALWMLAAAGYTLVYTLSGHDVRDNIQPFSLFQWLLWGTCLVITGCYATLSWFLGGSTLGMRPWRLRVVSASGGRPSPHAVWARFAVGVVSLLAGGLGFWWAWVDRDHLTWHDRASGTRMIRMPKGWDPDDPATAFRP